MYKPLGNPHEDDYQYEECPYCGYITQAIGDKPDQCPYCFPKKTTEKEKKKNQDALYRALKNIFEVHSGK